MTLTRQAMEAIHRPLEKRGIALTSCFEVDSAEVIGDPDRLEQVIINLIDNAGKFADPHAPRVSLHLAQHRQASVSLSPTTARVSTKPSANGSSRNSTSFPMPTPREAGRAAADLACPSAAGSSPIWAVGYGSRTLPTSVVLAW